MAIKTRELLPSAARTTTGSGSVADVGGSGATITGAAKGRFFLDASAASGTSPTLDVTVVGIVNGREHTIVTFTQLVAAGQETFLVEVVPDQIRVDFTITGGTPSFTFAVDVVLED